MHSESTRIDTGLKGDHQVAALCIPTEKLCFERAQQREGSD